MTYLIVDKDTGAIVRAGDRVRHFRPENGTGVFEAVTQGPETGKPVKVQVDGRIHFAKAWRLVVTITG